MIAAKTFSAFDGLDESERIRLGHQRRLIDSELLLDVSSVVSVFLWSQLIQCICIYFTSWLIDWCTYSMYCFDILVPDHSIHFSFKYFGHQHDIKAVNEIRSWWMISKERFGFVDSHNILDAPYSFTCSKLCLAGCGPKVDSTPMLSWQKWIVRCSGAKSFRSGGRKTLASIEVPSTQAILDLLRCLNPSLKLSLKTR